MSTKKEKQLAPQGDVTKAATSLILPPSDWEEYAGDYQNRHGGLGCDQKLNSRGCWLLYEGQEVHPYFGVYMNRPLVQHLRMDFADGRFAAGEENAIPLILRDLNARYWKMVQPIAWEEYDQGCGELPLGQEHLVPIVDAKVFRELVPNRQPSVHILFTLAIPYLKPLAADLGDRIAAMASKPATGHVARVEARAIDHQARLLAYLLANHEDRLIIDCHPGYLLLEALERDSLFHTEDEALAA